MMSEQQDQTVRANQELLASLGLHPEPEQGDYLKITPYSDGSGFSLKIGYPKWILDNIPPEQREKIFGFLSLAIYHPADSEKTKNSIGILRVSAAKVPEDIFGPGSVTPLDSGEKHLPLPLTEEFYFDPKESLVFFPNQESEPGKSLKAVIDELWKQHIDSSRPLTSVSLRVQRRVRWALNNRHLPFLFLTELLVWVSSGETFVPDNIDDSNEDGPNDYFRAALKEQWEKKNDEWIAAWLKRTLLSRVRYTDSNKSSIKVNLALKSDTVGFHGINVPPVSVLWFYLIVVGFYFYRSLSQPIGEMDFLNAYWNAILFFAPLTVILLAKVIPSVCKLVVNFLISRSHTVQSEAPRSFALKQFWKFYYYGKSEHLEFDMNDYKAA